MLKFSKLLLSAFGTVVVTLCLAFWDYSKKNDDMTSPLVGDNATLVNIFASFASAQIAKNAQFIKNNADNISEPPKK